ncbi:fasciclin-2-like [Achroia grisella]|uniref:fasciclin-2-like n=1 Tax=Achroia grisella TaxID=688607 RepID=UPI0027D2F7E7|nr:fasciclin-2-like [Achroia grisella]
MYYRENKMEFKFAVVFIILLSTKGSYSCNNDISISPPIIQESKRATTPIYLECHCIGSKVKANLKWLDINNKEIEALRSGPKPDMYTEIQQNKISLHIPSLSKTMSGAYKCINEHNNGSSNEIQQYILDVYERPSIRKDDKQFISLGKDSKIKCETFAVTLPMISWHKKSDDLIKIFSDDKYEIFSDGLLIRNVTQEDAGSYLCSVLDLKYSEEVDMEIAVEVMIEPKIEHLVASPDRTLIAGEALTLECIADGVPYPEFTWSKITNTNPAVNNTNWIVLENKILFENITGEDQGTYECTAKNNAGEAKKQLVIEVLVPPQITEFSNKTVPVGSVAQIVCNTIGRPTPNVSIIFIGNGNDEELSESTEDDILNNLSFITVDSSYEGFYICNASNEIDFVTKTMYLSVLKKPYFKQPNETIWGWNGKTVNLSCESEANPKPNITWIYLGNEKQSLDDFNVKKQFVEKLNEKSDTYYFPIHITTNSTQLYGVFQCVARNNLGEATKYIYFREGFVPPPIKHASGATTATSASFQIVGPDYLVGPPIIGITCEYDEASNYGITDIHKNRTWSIDREFKLDKLKPQTTYNIKFAAQNEVGIGEWSAPFIFETLKPSTPNSPVWEVDSPVVNVSKPNQLLKWKAADDNGDPIDYYTLRYCLNCEIDEESCKKMNINTINELQLNTNIFNTNTTYCIELLAHNHMGDSDAASITVHVAALVTEHTPVLSAGAIIGIAVVVVLLALLILDLILLIWRQQGIIANCYYKKNKKRKDDNLQTRDKKGLLRANCESVTEDSLNKPGIKHKEYEYNKTTGIITGKHSAV